MPEPDSATVGVESAESPVPVPVLLNVGAGPCDPVSPLAPVAPVDPVDPVAPVSPLAPVAPALPVEPVAPVAPLAPFLTLKVVVAPFVYVTVYVSVAPAIPALEPPVEEVHVIDAIPLPVEPIDPGNIAGLT